MARLPDETAFGEEGTQLSGRPIATYDTTGFSRGAAALAGGAKDLGEGIQQLGKGMAVLDHHQKAEAEKERLADQKLELARGNADLTTRLLTRANTIETERDPTGLADRHGKEAAQELEKASLYINDPNQRAIFLEQGRDNVTKVALAAKNRELKLTTDAGIAVDMERADKVKDEALKSNDPEATNKAVGAVSGIIDGWRDKGWIDQTKAVDLKRDWVVKFVTGKLSTLPAEQRLDELRAPATGRDAVLDRIGKVENSSGNPAARAVTSSAMGDFQFIKKTWLETVRANRPDLLEGRTEKQVLDLRADPKLSREMAGYLLDANGPALQRAGLEPTPQNLYLAHFLGPGAAAAVLKAKPGTPVSDIVDEKAIAANSSVLAGKTTDSVIDWATRKMGSGGKMSALLPEDTRVKLAHEAQREVDTGIVKAAAAQSELWERKIIDASAGTGVLPNRKDIETDPALDEPRRNVLLRQHDAAAGDVVGLQNFLTKMKDSAGGAFNPYDKEEQKYADVAYRSLGGDMPALQAIVSRTGILPKSAAATIKGDTVSSNPERVASALTLSANLLGTNPNIFVGVEGKADLENNAVAFRHYVDELGMKATDAAKNIIRDQSSEYQAKVKARIKSEDVDTKIRKELTIGDLSGAFDQSWIPFNDPKVAFDVRTRQTMFSQFAELVKDAYLDSSNGDMSLAKKQAANQLKKTWGVTSVNGSPVVMQYAPERAPAYANIPNPADVIAKQAVESIKAETGQVADRSGVRLMPIAGATAAAYKAGQPVPYEISWTDKNGILQTMSPGRAFVADPVAMRGEVVAERKAVVEAGQFAADKAGDDKLMGTADRFLSQKQREKKRGLIEARDFSITEGEAELASGADQKTKELISTVGRALTKPAPGRLGTR